MKTTKVDGCIAELLQIHLCYFYSCMSSQVFGSESVLGSIEYWMSTEAENTELSPW